MKEETVQKLLGRNSRLKSGGGGEEYQVTGNYIHPALNTDPFESETPKLKYKRIPNFKKAISAFLHKSLLNNLTFCEPCNIVYFNYFKYI